MTATRWNVTITAAVYGEDRPDAFEALAVQLIGVAAEIRRRPGRPYFPLETGPVRALEVTAAAAEEGTSS
jgi:hypothetical protein